MSTSLRSSTLRSLALASSAIASLTLANPAHAEQAGDVDLGADSATPFNSAGDEIVVTASRRREERIQDVPVALTVVSATALERRGDFTLGQIQQQVPSLQVFSFNPRNTNVNIRGLGSTVALTNDGLENGVGFYIDNVYYGRVGLSQFDLVDLEKVEVLRGPQGTLFGKNTTAGVVNITSRAPSFDPEFSGEATVGNHGFVQLRGSASGAIVPDKIAVRLSAASSKRDGFLYNTTQRSDAQDYDNTSVRGQLLFTPDDDLSIRIIGDYAKQKLDYSLAVFVDNHTSFADGTPLPNNFSDRAARFPGYTLPTFRPFDRKGEADSHYQADMEGYGVSGELNWKLGRHTLTSITAYRWWDWYPANDADNTSLPILTKAQQINHQRQFSQELRLASDSSGPVSYVAGAYYFWQVVKGYGATRYGSAAALWNLPALGPVVGNAALDGFEANSISTPTTKSLAAFGQLDWKVTPTLTLTTGLRYTHEKKSGRFSQFWVDGDDLSGLTPEQAAIANGVRTAFNPVLDFKSAIKDNSLSGLVTLGWKVTPDALVYATYSRGNKSGGLNLTALPAGVEASVKPEKVDAFELGFKSQWLNRRLTFNGALFWTEIGNYQASITENVLNTVNVRQYISNIPKVRSRGFEGELTYAPTDRFSVNASVAYAEATYLKYTNAPQAPENLNKGAIQDLSGTQLPGVPKFTYSIGADGNVPVGEFGGREVELYGHADWSHRSHFNAQNNGSNSAWADIPGYGLANARIGVRTGDGLIDVSLWAKNLFDKNYFNSLTAANTGVVTGQIGEPRTWGVTLRTKL